MRGLAVIRGMAWSTGLSPGLIIVRSQVQVLSGPHFDMSMFP